MPSVYDVVKAGPRAEELKPMACHCSRATLDVQWFTFKWGTVYATLAEGHHMSLPQGVGLVYASPAMPDDDIEEYWDVRPPREPEPAPPSQGDSLSEALQRIVEQGIGVDDAGLRAVEREAARRRFQLPPMGDPLRPRSPRELGQEAVQAALEEAARRANPGESQEARLPRRALATGDAEAFGRSATVTDLNRILTALGFPSGSSMLLQGDGRLVLTITPNSELTVAIDGPNIVITRNPRPGSNGR